MSNKNMYFTDELGKAIIKDVEVTINGQKVESNNIPINSISTQYKKVDHFQEWLDKLEDGTINEIPDLSEITLEKIKNINKKGEKRKLDDMNKQ